MQDKLEDFIRENREAFDTAEPRHAVWEKIDVTLSDTKTRTLSSPMWIWKAAVVVLLGAVVFLVVERSTLQPEVVAEVSPVEEFDELESYYSSLISQKKVKIDQELSSDEVFTFLQTEVEEIDAIYEELKETFNKEQETPAVLDALVHLLRQKLHLLDSQLDAINELKSNEGKSTEGVSSL